IAIVVIVAVVAIFLMVFQTGIRVTGNVNAEPKPEPKHVWVWHGEGGFDSSFDLSGQLCDKINEEREDQDYQSGMLFYRGFWKCEGLPGGEEDGTCPHCCGLGLECKGESLPSLDEKCQPQPGGPCCDRDYCLPGTGGEPEPNLQVPEGWNIEKTPDAIHIHVDPANVETGLIGESAKALEDVAKAMLKSDLPVVITGVPATIAALTGALIEVAQNLTGAEITASKTTTAVTPGNGDTETTATNVEVKTEYSLGVGAEVLGVKVKVKLTNEGFPGKVAELFGLPYGISRPLGFFVPVSGSIEFNPEE
ncbi:MAG: hypothetical protein KKC75_07075, partial [Nanoarchaeota archaeon]|nr:hypothetical protein [Nanoarchaeota archaeon]MBU1947020.1 hypothetical protein [Nanoarchaeota archaeon]